MTLSADASPGGGKFVWKNGDSSKPKITGSGSTVAVKGLDEGEIQVMVVYTPPGCGSCSTSATVKVKYEVRHVLVAQGIQFTNEQLAKHGGIEKLGDQRVPVAIYTIS